MVLGSNYYSSEDPLSFSSIYVFLSASVSAFVGYLEGKYSWVCHWERSRDAFNIYWGAVKHDGTVTQIINRTHTHQIHSEHVIVYEYNSDIILRP